LTEPDPLMIPSLQSLGLAGDRPLVIVDVDEVLGLFMRALGDFAASRGFEMRIERFTIMESLYRPGSVERVTVEEGRSLIHDFFRTECGEMSPAPGAVEALGRLSRRAEIIVFSNAPAQAQPLRAAWLKRHGLSHPLILGVGPKGPMTAGLTAQTPHRSAFVDDMLHNLDSVAQHAPATARFQHVADERLRPHAPTKPEHRRIDDWAELGAAIEEAIGSPIFG
jgi:hypothetical protein